MKHFLTGPLISGLATIYFESVWNWGVAKAADRRVDDYNSCLAGRGSVWEQSPSSSMDSSLSIFKKGLLLVSIPLLSELLFLGILAMTRADLAEAQVWALHTKEVIAQLETARRLPVEAQSHIHSFVLTGDPRFADRFQQVHNQSRQAMARLRDLVKDNPSQQDRVATMAGQTEQLLAWLQEILRLQQAGQRSEVDARLQSGEGPHRIEQLGAAYRQFLDEEERMDQDRRAFLERTTQRQNWALFAGLVIALASTAAMVYAFSRGIGGRMARLTDNVRRLTEGKEMSPPLAGRDEISLLDQAFHDMAEVLAQKNRENEMFVYSVSHDLRAPLVNLQGFSLELGSACKDLRGLLADPALPDGVREPGIRLIDHEVAESVQYIQTAVSRLAGIIDGLLRLSRVGRVEYHMQVVDVEAIVRGVIGSLRDSIAKRTAQVVVKPLAKAWADPTAADQIFANLIGNAVNYLDPHRPGTIVIGCADGPVEGAPPGLDVYYVQDNGLGIPAEFQDKVFLAFQRLHPAAAPGEGIGLALVRRVVERHGGKIWLASTVGVGSTFYVALPAPAAQALQQQAEAAA
jgi:signal transduction histidine kinase